MMKLRPEGRGDREEEVAEGRREPVAEKGSVR
jgi:hypothetical protein